MTDNPFVELNVTVDTEALESVNTRFDSVNMIISNLASKIVDGAEDGAEQLAYNIQNLEKQYLVLNGNYLTGELYNSIETEGGSLSYNIGSNLDGYSPNVIEYGRTDVYPQTASVLHYYDARLGKEIFSHHSSAYKGDPYVAPSAEDARQIGDKIVLDSIMDKVR
jgi:hypothetical protein